MFNIKRDLNPKAPTEALIELEKDREACIRLEATKALQHRTVQATKEKNTA